jgi:hypothetical protein
MNFVEGGFLIDIRTKAAAANNGIPLQAGKSPGAGAKYLTTDEMLIGASTSVELPRYNLNAVRKR